MALNTFEVCRSTVKLFACPVKNLYTYIKKKKKGNIANTKCLKVFIALHLLKKSQSFGCACFDCMFTEGSMLQGVEPPWEDFASFSSVCFKRNLRLFSTSQLTFVWAELSTQLCQVATTGYIIHVFIGAMKILQLTVNYRSSWVGRHTNLWKLQ